MIANNKYLSVLIIIIKCSGHQSRDLNGSNYEQSPYEKQMRNEFFNEAAEKIHDLENKLQSLEMRIPKTYPEVKFLNYLHRKRILVNTKNYCFFSNSYYRLSLIVFFF